MYDAAGELGLLTAAGMAPLGAWLMFAAAWDTELEFAAEAAGVSVWVAPSAAGAATDPNNSASSSTVTRSILVKTILPIA